MDVLEILRLLSGKSIVVWLAVVGAFFTILPNFLSGKSTDDKSTVDHDPGNTGGGQSSWKNLANKIGYSLMGLSVFLFIVAGFIVDL